MAVRFTAKNGDYAEAGKIWENQIFTRKMDYGGAKCTQIDESICQGFRNTRRNQFSFIFQAVTACSFDVILQFTPRGPKYVQEMLLLLAFVTK